MRIEGADGSRVVVASAMPVQGIPQQQSMSVDGDGYDDSGTCLPFADFFFVTPP